MGGGSQLASSWLWVITCSLKCQGSSSPCFYGAEVTMMYVFPKAGGDGQQGSLE